MQKMMKKLSKKGGMKGMMRQMQGMMPPGGMGGLGGGGNRFGESLVGRQDTVETEQHIRVGETGMGRVIRRSAGRGTGFLTCP